jgi:hypothetical protein
MARNTDAEAARRAQDVVGFVLPPHHPLPYSEIGGEDGGVLCKGKADLYEFVVFREERALLLRMLVVVGRRMYSGLARWRLRLRRGIARSGRVRLMMRR